MNSCSDNTFCASLPPSTRRKLCGQCQRHLIKKGSLRFYEEFNKEMHIILDGAICGSFRETDAADTSQALPIFALNLPGRILGLDATAFGRTWSIEQPQSYCVMTYLTDCVMATFSHEAFLKLLETDKHFALSTLQSSVLHSGDAIQLSAILRAESIQKKVLLLMRTLIKSNVYLSRGDIAMLLGCNRTSISKAFAYVASEAPTIYDQYLLNKNRRIGLTNLEWTSKPSEKKKGRRTGDRVDRW